MQFTTTALALIAASASVMAAPLDARAVSGMAAVPNWVIKSFTRTCNAADTACTVSFGIDTADGAAVRACKYKVKGAPASRTRVDPLACGPYSVSSDWSGQFGEGNGFTTWAVSDWSKRRIAYPSYSDADVPNGTAITPDRSFAVHSI